MCGIAGFAGAGRREDIRKMTALLLHRGPDGEGFWASPGKPVFLGHRRLSIIDIDGGVQPMWTGDGALGIVYNGEIYNHVEIRRELESLGYTFKTDHSDTEALLLAYRQWGDETPVQLNGMWAFAVYDTKKNKIFISRDRFGQKPLYYTRQNGTFAFSSELKSLISHSRIQSTISKKSLQKYFAYGYLPAPNALFENIYKLPAGHNLVLNCADLSYRVMKYWEFELEPFETIPRDPENDWGEEIRSLLSRSVKRRLLSDVPLGVFLSGGIDSSSIAAVAQRMEGEKKVATFCTGFNEDSFDESHFGRYAASLLGTEHHTAMLSIQKARSILPEIVKKMDEPLGDSSLLPTWLLCKNTRKHVTVVLGGDGADELFAGYDPFHALKLSQTYKQIVPGPVHKAIRMMATTFPVSNKNISLDFKLKRTLCGLSYAPKLWNPVWLGPVEPDEFRELFSENIDIEDIYSEAIESWENCKQDNIVDKTLQFYTKIYLQDSILAKIDRAGMMHSLEVRSPYLDIDLVNFVRKIPYFYKYRNGQTKYILKKALHPLLPEKIINRKKHGFGMPIGKWFQEGYFTLHFDDTEQLFDPSFSQKKMHEHIKKGGDNRLFLYSLFILKNYMQTIL